MLYPVMMLVRNWGVEMARAVSQSSMFQPVSALLEANDEPFLESGCPQSLVSTGRHSVILRDFHAFCVKTTQRRKPQIRNPGSNRLGMIYAL